MTDIQARIDRVIELDKNRTPGEWKYNELNSVQSINFGDYLKREEHLDLTDKAYELWSSLNYKVDICTCIRGLGSEKRPYRNDARFITAAPEMVSIIKELKTENDALMDIVGKEYDTDMTIAKLLINVKELQAQLSDKNVQLEGKDALIAELQKEISKKAVADYNAMVDNLE